MEFLRGLDHDLFFWIHQNLHAIEGPSVEIVLRFVGAFGSGLILIPVAAALLVLCRSRREIWYRGAALVATFAAMGVIVPVAKTLIGRRRPMSQFKDLVEQGIVHTPFGEVARKGSFPSGDTATAFALAMLLTLWACETGVAWKRRLVFVLAFGFALLVGVQRIYAAAHFPLDVLVGALLGMALALAGYTLARRRLGAPH